MMWIVLAALTAVYIAAAALIASREWAVETLPIAFAALSVAVLWDGRLAAMLALTLAVLGVMVVVLGVIAVLVLGPAVRRAMAERHEEHAGDSGEGAESGESAGSGETAGSGEGAEHGDCGRG